MITQIKDLKKFINGVEVELPGFNSDAPFICKIKRPSLLSMAENGTIPNPLLGAAADLFNNTNRDKISLHDMSEIMTIVAKAAMCEPSLADLEKEGLSLTDMQLLYIYNYTQTGVDSLKSFREKQAVNTTDKPSKPI